jgi:hypothetical protein
VEKALEGQKPRGVSAVSPGKLGVARTDSQEDQGFEVGEAGGMGRLRRSGSRGTGRYTFGSAKWKPRRHRGNQATALKGVGVGETGVSRPR